MRKQMHWMAVLVVAAPGCGMTPMEPGDKPSDGGSLPGPSGTGGTSSAPTTSSWTAPAAGGTGGTSPCDGQAVAWQTNTVSLQAERFWIVADGQCYTSRGSAVEVHSDPGHSRYTTLELTWTERGREMRWYVYLEANASGWWSEEMRTYDGQLPDSEWLYYYGRFFASPIGQAFHGDIALTNDPQDKIRGELHLRGLTLSTTMTGS